jgi:hypothetical protein
MKIVYLNSLLIIYEYDNFKSLYVKAQTINPDTTVNIINVHSNGKLLYVGNNVGNI